MAATNQFDPLNRLTSHLCAAYGNDELGRSSRRFDLAGAGVRWPRWAAADSQRRVARKLLNVWRLVKASESPMAGMRLRREFWRHRAVSRARILPWI